MMQRLVLPVSLLLAIVIGSCKYETVVQAGSHQVRGTVLSRGTPVARATVSLNGRAEFTMQSDSTGTFVITNVPVGNYALTAVKAGGNGGFQARTTAVSVSADVSDLSVVLPQAVRIDTPVNVSPSSVRVSWTPTDAADFREYKLFRHTTSGLDEHTGTLAHVSTTVNDTVFLDEGLSPSTMHYYRVYVMNEYGNLGGSGITSVRTAARNAVLNGSFESFDPGTGMANSWGKHDESGHIRVDSLSATDGTKSLFTNLAPTETGGYRWLFYQTIDPALLEGGRRYRFTFWFKTDSLEQFDHMTCWFANSWNLGLDNVFIVEDFVDALAAPRPPIPWTKYAHEFTAPTSKPANFLLVFGFDRVGTYGYEFHLPMKVWIDDVRIEAVE